MYDPPAELTEPKYDLNKTLVAGTGGYFVHPNLRPKTRDGTTRRKQLYTIESTRYRTTRTNSAHRQSRPKIINERSSQ